jgi:PAS domain S-box-containing protein
VIELIEAGPLECPVSPDDRRRILLVGCRLGARSVRLEVGDAVVELVEAGLPVPGEASAEAVVTVRGAAVGVVRATGRSRRMTDLEAAAETVAAWLTDAWAAAEEIDSLAREVVHAYEELHLLYGLGEALGDRLSVAAAAEIILEQTVAALGAARAELRLAGPEGTIFVRPAAAAGAPGGPAAGARHRLTAELRSGGRAVGQLEIVRAGRGAPFSSSDGKLLDAVGALAGGALRNAQLYEELRQQAEALRQREAHLSAVLDSTADGVVAVDADGLVESFNRAAEVIFGYAAAEVVARPVGRLFDGDELLYGDLAVQLGTREARGRRKSGQTFPMDLAVADVRLGARRLFILSVQDITERKQTAETLLRTERLRALGQLASGVAHDINHSLAIIAGFGDLARQGLERPDPDLATLRTFMGLVVQAAMDGSETVNRLLRFGRGHQEGEQTVVDVGAILADVAELTAPRWRDASQAEGRVIAMKVEAQPGAYVLGWASALRELCTNLVFNAIDAMPDGGAIRLRARHHPSPGAGPSTVEVEVTDTGTGMTPDVRDRIFEPFYSTKGARGTGMGLAMVFAITEQHGGTIGVETAPGAGATFRLRFPAAATVEAPAPPERTARPHPPGTQHPSEGPGTRPKDGWGDPAPATRAAEASGLRILAVDDRAEITLLLSETLTLEGHTVVLAESGEEAEARLEAARFDLVISDIGLGTGMNGWELVDRVRARWPGVRLIVATGWGAQVDPAEARARGVEAVLSKPFRPSDLRRAVAGPSGDAA